jgi:MFS family permease
MNAQTRLPATAEPSLSRPWLFLAACAGMFTFGTVIALLGAVFGLPAMRERLSIDFAQQGDLFGILSAGLICSSILSGPVLDRFGSKATLVAASLMVSAALLAFGFARGFAPAAAAAALLGFGGSWLNVGTNALVSDVYPEERARWLNLLGAVFGVGALFVPALLSLGFDRLSVPGTLVACAGVAVFSAIVSAVPRFPSHARAPFSLVEMVRTARYPGVVLFAVLLFFQSGNESALSGWVSTYVGSVGWSPRAANNVLVGYWVMAILGRSVSSKLQAWMGQHTLVLASSLLSIGGCLVLLVAPGSFPGLVLGAWVTALAFSGIVPTTLAMAGNEYPRLAGMLFAFLFSVSGFGNMVSPWAIGHVSQAFGVRLGMLIPLAGSAGVCACTMLVARRGR